MKRFLRFFAVAALSAGFFSARAGGGDSPGETVLKNDKKGDQKSSFEQQSATPSPKLKNTQLRFSGYSRVLGLYRNMSEYYGSNTELGGKPLTLPVAISLDDGASQPMLMLRIEANPSANSSLQIESSLNNYLINNATGIATLVDPNNPGRIANIFAGFHVKGSTITNFGKFTMTAGAGSIWAKMSPFTLWNFQYRDDMFERYPWDPAGSNWRRYDSYYSTGDIPRDQRWGNRGMQGFSLEGENMPFGLETKLVYGKTRSTGGFNNWNNGIPQNMIGARVGKRLGRILVGANYYNQFGYDTVFAIKNEFFQDIYNTSDTNRYVVDQSNKTSQLIVSADAAIKLTNVRIYTEIGGGSYLSKTYYNQSTFEGMSDGQQITSLKRNWSPIMYLEADIQKGLIGWPFKASLYYVGQHAVNNQSTILNSSVEEATDGRNIGITNSDAIWNVYFYDGMVSEIGQLTNNRQGIDLTTKKKFGKFQVELGLQFAQEIVNHGTTVDTADFLNGARAGTYIDSEGKATNVLPQGQGGVRNSITFPHIVNQYQRSRFHYNQRFQGPYQRLQSDYRRSWENLAITDTLVDYKKAFNVIDLTVKYKTKFLKRDLILSGFFRQNTVSENSPLPALKADGKTFLVQRYEELMAFYKLHQKVTLIAVAGFEQNKGNVERTEIADEEGNAILAENGTPMSYYKLTDDQKDKVKAIDQVGYGYGFGVDYDFTDRASLDVRYKYYGHKDKLSLIHI